MFEWLDFDWTEIILFFNYYYIIFLIVYLNVNKDDMLFLEKK